MQTSDTDLQKIIICNRIHGSISGVNEVLSFDSTCAVFDTEQGELILDGQDLTLKNLDNENGTVEFDGKIDGISFRETESKGFFKRLFS